LNGAEVAEAHQEPPSLASFDLFSGADPVILGIDNVRLELPVAGVGSRFLAIALDQIVVLLAAALWLVLCLALGSLAASTIGMTPIIIVTVIGIFLLDAGYFSICEIRMGGRTPGKSALGLRTVNSLGGQASTAAILVRNALRVFDYLVGIILILVDSRRRRLGDLVASTLVIHDPEPVPEEEVQLGRLPAFFESREIALVETLLRRLPRLLPQKARELASQFLAALSSRDPDFLAAAPGAPLEDPVFELWRVFAVRAAAPEQA